MSHGDPIQLHLHVGLEDKCSILNQCFNITLKTTQDCTKLMHSWNVLAQEENWVVGKAPQIYWK
jgi:hypothetical protein